MTTLREKMIGDMQLHHFTESTQKSYLIAVYGLAKYQTAKIVKRNLEQGDSVAHIAARYGVTKKDKVKTSKPKINYNPVIDWKEYNEGLVKRGEFLIDFDVLYDWKEGLRELNGNKIGGLLNIPTV